MASLPMSLLRGCSAMFTLQLLLCFGAVVSGALKASALPRRCGGADCGVPASQSVQPSSPTPAATPQMAALNRRSEKSFSVLRSGTTDATKMQSAPRYGDSDSDKSREIPAIPPFIVKHDMLRGDTSTASQLLTPSAIDVISGRLLSKKTDYLLRKDFETHREKYVSNEATTMSSVYLQRSNHEIPMYMDLLHKYHYGRLGQERVGDGTNLKENKQSQTPLGVSAMETSQSHNFESGAVVDRISWKHSTAEVPYMVKEAIVISTSVRDDVVRLGNSASTTQEETDSKSSAIKSGITLQSTKVASLAQPTASQQSHRSSVEGYLPKGNRPSTPDTSERVDQDVRGVAKLEDSSPDSAALPSTIADNFPADEIDTGLIGTPEYDLDEPDEEIQDAIVRDATLIVVFSCLAVASLALWRIIRCITMHKLKQHEKKLAAEKASTV